MALFRASEFASGTRILFQQSTAPTGWTKDTTHNDKSLRVVNGSVGSGGSVSFSSFAAQSIGATTLSAAQMPSHSHSFGGYSQSLDLSLSNATGYRTDNGGSTNVSSTGGGGSHTHSLNMSMQYVDTIIAVKN